MNDSLEASHFLHHRKRINLFRVFQALTFSCLSLSLFSCLSFMCVSLSLSPSCLSHSPALITLFPRPLRQSIENILSIVPNQH